MCFFYLSLGFVAFLERQLSLGEWELGAKCVALDYPTGCAMMHQPCCIERVC